MRNANTMVLTKGFVSLLDTFLVVIAMLITLFSLVISIVGAFEFAEHKTVCILYLISIVILMLSDLYLQIKDTSKTYDPPFPSIDFSCVRSIMLFLGATTTVSQIPNFYFGKPVDYPFLITGLIALFIYAYCRLFKI